MTRRSYDPELQAALSERIRTAPREEWQEFLNLWMAFNAIYNTREQEDIEREQVRSSADALEESAAERLLERLRDPARELAGNPPGDMRYESSSPQFYRAVENDVEALTDRDGSATQQIGALLALVYQVRCNLIHGNKDPARERDLQLVRISNTVLGAVLPKLEEAIAQS